MANPSPSPNKRASMPNIGLSTGTSLSILKPLKARCPLKDLDLVPNTEDDTTTTTFSTRVKRRVSFAGVNKVKEFHTAAESLTVNHTPAYDEPFITTMSSDSSGQHHLTDSKLSDGTGLDQMSRYYTDAVLDLTVKSTDNSNFKVVEEIDYEGKENYGDNCRPLSQNTYYEADMECTTPHAGAFSDPKSFSFVNKSSMEFTSVVSGFSEGMLSKSGMEFTDIIHNPLRYSVNGSKQFESMELTHQIDGGIVVCGENSYPSSAFQPGGGFNYVQNEAESEITSEFSQSLPKASIFTNQALSSSEPTFLQAGVGQINSIFGRQSAVRSDFNDSNDMSFGVTGFISMPLIETAENCVETEVNARNNVSKLVQEASQSSRIECSNPDESEMELTEANAFTNSEALHLVPDNLEAVKKSVCENLEMKPDPALSFLRNLSGLDKSHSYSSRSAKTVAEPQENQGMNASNSIVNSIVSDLSISKSVSMELTKAVCSSVKSNSCVDEMSVLKTSAIELTGAVAYVSETSITKNRTMESTKTVKRGDSNLALVEISGLNATSENMVLNAAKKDGSENNGVENFSESKDRNATVGEDPSEYLPKARCTSEFDTADFNASNVVTSTQESKSENNFEGEVNDPIERKSRVSRLSQNPVEFPSENKCGGASETVDFNATGVATSTQEPKVTENVPSSEKFTAVSDSINFDSTNVATSTQKSRFSRSIPVVADGRKSISIDSFLNIGAPIAKKCGKNLDMIDPEILALEMELFKGEIRTAPNYNPSQSPLSNNVEKPCYESKLACSQEVYGSQPMEFSNINASAGKINSQSASGCQSMEFTNVNASTGNANFETNSQSTSDSESMKLTNASTGNVNFETNSQRALGSESMELTNVNASAANTNFEANSQSTCGREAMELSNANTCMGKVSSQSSSGSQSMELTNVNAFAGNANFEANSNNSQDAAGSQSMELTNVNTSMGKASSQSNYVSESMELANANAFVENENFERNESMELTNTGENANVGTNSQSAFEQESMELTNVNVCTRNAKLEGTAQSVSDSQEMELINIHAPQGQMSQVGSQNLSTNQSMEFSKAHAFSAEADYEASSQEISGSHLLESTRGSTYDNRTNVDTFEFANASLEAEIIKDRRKSRRSELFVPMQKPVSKTKMSFIEESDAGDDLGSFGSRNFSHSATEKNEDKKEFETLKSSDNLSKENIDCAYKIHDSQMFTKSMLEQTACEDSFISEPAKQTADPDVLRSDSGNVLLASMIKSFHHELSLNSEFYTSLSVASRKDALSQLIFSKSITFQETDLKEPDMRECTETFGGFLGAAHNTIENSPIVKPPDSSVISGVFEESRFTMPIENIPRSVFLTDDVYCPTLSNISGFPSQAASVQESMKQGSSSERSCCVEESHESSVENKTREESQTVETLLNEIVSEKFAHVNNDELVENCGDDDIGSPNLCDESFPAVDFTINEEQLKNITLERSKIKMSSKKARSFVDLDDSITRRHDENIKKVRVSNESCDITGIAKLPDLTVNSAESSPPEKLETEMDVSIRSVNENQCLSDEDLLTNSIHDPLKLRDGDLKEVEKSLELGVNEVSKTAPKTIITNREEPLTRNAKVAFNEMGKTPRSVLKKTGNLNTTKTTTPSQPSTQILNSEAKKVCFMDSSEPKKRGFVRKAANLYSSFVATVSATPNQKDQRTNFSDVKRALDESYSKENNQLLKVFLEKVKPNANVTMPPETSHDQTRISEENLEDISLKYVTFSPEDGFEKTNYTPKGSSNTSMICHDDHDSNLSPIFKTPKSVLKSAGKPGSVSMTPNSPARKRQKLPFGSTPVKTESNKSEMLSELSCDSSSLIENNSTCKLSPGSPNGSEHCPEFAERFIAETRPTKEEWNVVGADSALWSFEFLNGRLQLNIHFEEPTWNAPPLVKDITFFSVPIETKPGESKSRNGKAIRIIGQNILLEKYPIHRLRSICKSCVNVFDVLHMIGTDSIYVRKVMNILSKMISARFTNTSMVIPLTSLRPTHIVEITVDLTSWKSLSASSVSVNNIIGNIRLQVIRGFFDECDKNEDCLRQFWEKCTKYVYELNFTNPKGPVGSCGIDSTSPTW